MANDVVVHVIVTDDASPALRKVGQETDKVGTSASGAGSSMLSMGVAFAAVTTAATVAAGVMYSFYATNRDLELQLRKSTTVFGEQLPVVKAWADSNAAAMGLSSNQATNLAASMADLLIPMGMTRDAATEMATKTIGLAGALSEWSGGQRTAAEAASILQKAFLGETDGLKELGIAISAEQVMAELAKKGQEDLTGASLEQAKALAIQTLVFAKSTDAQTAYADGAGTAARSQAELTARLVTAHEQMSTALAPAIAAVAGALIGVMIPAIDGLVAVFKFLVDNGTAVASALGGIAAAISVLMVPKLILLISTTWAYVAALTAQAVAFAIANPLLGLAAVAAGVAAAAAIKLALGTASATVETEKNKSATEMQTASTNAQTSALSKATEAADKHARALNNMSFAQIAAEFARNQESGVPDPRVTADLTFRARQQYQYESGLKASSDAFIESITGEKARAASIAGAATAASAAVKALTDAETALAAFRQGLAEENNLALAEAYRAGGLEQVEIVKASQADQTLIMETLAADLQRVLDIDYTEALKLAVKVLGNESDRAAASTKKAADALQEMGKNAVTLTQQLWAAIGGSNATKAGLVGVGQVLSRPNAQGMIDTAALDKMLADMNAQTNRRDTSVPMSMCGGGPERPSVTVNVEAGIIASPDDVARTVADAINRASSVTGPMLVAGAVE